MWLLVLAGLVLTSCAKTEYFWPGPVEDLRKTRVDVAGCELYTRQFERTWEDLMGNPRNEWFRRCMKAKGYTVWPDVEP